MDGQQTSVGSPGTRCAAALRIAKSQGEVSWGRVAEIIDKTLVEGGPALSLSGEFPLNKKVRVPRKRDELIDGLIVVCGFDPLTATPRAVRAAAVATAEIKSVHPLLTTEDLERTAKLYKRNHPDWPLTPNALASHWHEFNRSEKQREAKARLDPYTAPAGWQEVAEKMYPNIELPSAFLDLPITIRIDIVNRCA